MHFSFVAIWKFSTLLSAALMFVLIDVVVVQDVVSLRRIVATTVNPLYHQRPMAEFASALAIHVQPWSLMGVVHCALRALLSGSLTTLGLSLIATIGARRRCGASSLRCVVALIVVDRRRRHRRTRSDLRWQSSQEQLEAAGNDHARLDDV